MCIVRPNYIGFRIPMDQWRRGEWLPFPITRTILCYNYTIGGGTNNRPIERQGPGYLCTLYSICHFLYEQKVFMVSMSWQLLPDRSTNQQSLKKIWKYRWVSPIRTRSELFCGAVMNYDRMCFILCFGKQNVPQHVPPLLETLEEQSISKRRISRLCWEAYINHKLKFAIVCTC